MSEPSDGTMSGPRPSLAHRALALPREVKSIVRRGHRGYRYYENATVIRARDIARSLPFDPARRVTLVTLNAAPRIVDFLAARSASSSGVAATVIDLGSTDETVFVLGALSSLILHTQWLSPQSYNEPGWPLSAATVFVAIDDLSAKDGTDAHAVLRALADSLQRATSAPEPGVQAPTGAGAGTRTRNHSPSINTVALLPSSPYHFVEFHPVAQQLRDTGIGVEFWIEGDAGAPLRALLEQHGEDPIQVTPDLWRTGASPPKVLVVQNDWRTAIRTLSSQLSDQFSTTTVSKVEGIQDFSDIDTGLDRQPYRHSDLILNLGPHDATAIGNRPHRVVGSTRLEHVLYNPLPPVLPRQALINLNFTFGVFEWEAESWVNKALDACGSTGWRPCVSAHPSQTMLRQPLPLSTNPASHLLARSGVLITRFSTLMFEALAAGVPIIYFNPHNERAGAFIENHPGIIFADSAQTLRSHLGDLSNRDRPTLDERIASLKPFLSVDPLLSSAKRTADALLELLAPT